MWEEEKLLVTSNFSFSHSVFKRLELQICRNQCLFGKGLKPSVSGLSELRVMCVDMPCTCID